MPSIFSDHMVLRKGSQVPIWGNAAPHEKISVKIDSITVETEASAAGKWRAILNLQEMKPGPFEMVIQGNEKKVISDVVVGHVWLCSGQSNMEMPLEGVIGSEDETKASPNLFLRHFLVKKTASLHPQEDCEGKWVIASPESVLAFSAVAYFFGKSLQNELKVPVGLINASWGGTPCETWISEKGLSQDPELKVSSEKEVGYAKNYVANFKEYQIQWEKWTDQNGRRDREESAEALFAAPDLNEDDWKKIQLPGSLAKNGITESGAIWLRRKIRLPSKAPKDWRRGYSLNLGVIQGFESVYWNGVKIGGMTHDMTGTIDKRRYFVPENLMKYDGSEATLAIRIFNPVGEAGIEGRRDLFKADEVFLEGEWRAKVEYAFPPLNESSRSTYPRALKRPSEAPAGNLYNGMIHPIETYGVDGVIWYQGETNVGRAFQYRTAFPLLIRDWRTHWQRNDLPFYFCQLANFGPRKEVPDESEWAELREAQLRTLALPETGMAVLIDIGETESIHPRNKSDVGLRLSRIALAKVYRKSIEYSGPLYEKMEVEGNSIRIHFSHAERGLVARKLPESYAPKSHLPEILHPMERNSPASELEGFSICGEDRKWEWANARLEKGSVVVSSPSVKNPIAVRYGWADDPVCNLYNQEGLPASPFRTDDFPCFTAQRRF